MKLSLKKNWFFSSSVVSFFVVGFAILLGDKIPPTLLAFFYTLSLLIKSVLVFMLPFIIFTYLTTSILSFRKSAMTFATLLFGMVVISDFASLLTAYLVQGAHLIPEISSGVLTPVTYSLTPLWTFTLPKVLSNDQGIFLSFAIILLLSFKRIIFLEKGIIHLKTSIDFFMKRLFAPLLPIFIIGYVLKMRHDGIFDDILKNYAYVFAVISTMQAAYLFLMYLIASNFHLKYALKSIYNVFPACFTAFMTMSSEAALPLSIQCAERNSVHPAIVRSVIPATLNIHMIGDSLAVPILIMVILKTFGFEDFTFQSYFIFTGYLMVAKFAAGGIPAGSILAALPFLETQLGFTAEMSALITAIYILFDPIATSANVMGNGVFAIIFNKIIKKLERKRKLVLYSEEC